MVMTTAGDARDVSPMYPAPTVVLGVGRLGLAVLERLGEDWHSLSQAGGDASLANLRLVYVHPGREGETSRPAVWDSAERRTVELARRVGASDLPSLVLDFVILRSLGLVRHRDGTYQVAVPQDAGWVDREPRRESESVEREAPGEPWGERRRYFDWRDLDPDPVVAAERLQRVADRSTDLDLFITPILSRVRQGHSPATILACIRRLATLAEGRDPAPWAWLRWVLPRAEEDEAGARIVLETHEEAVELWGGDYLGRRLEGFAPPPLPGWDRWIRSLDTTAEVAADSEGPPQLEIRLPREFLPDDTDPVATLRAKELLEVDWETTGWATEGFGLESSVRFQPVEVSPFRLGLFDHDGTAGPRNERSEALADRLRRLAPLLDQGLVRLWVDLQRERVEERQPVLDDRRREHDETAVRQCLEILGELLVGSSGSVGAPTSETSGRDARTDSDPAEELPSEPSEFLHQLELPRQKRPGPVACLERRLDALGLGEDADEARRPLLHTVRIEPQDLLQDSEARTSRGLGHLAGVLNREVRALFDLGHLSAYRTQPTRRPPRLTVFLVGDMGEIFVRAAMRPLLRETHAELLRAFNPFLEFFRESFDRGLSVVPILWMPHPADPFEGRETPSRGEEAAIIDAVHGIRRWVESVVPPQRRRVSQIFVNSRVTDASVLRPREAVRQTRDFLSLLLRNEVGRDDWLRTVAEGAVGDDFFSCFSCYEIDFPAERSREYLANRLARDCLKSLREPEPLRSKSLDDEDEDASLFEPPELSTPVQEARSRIRRKVEAPAESLATRVERRVNLEPATTEADVRAAFDGAFELALLEAVHDEWRRLSRDHGIMDDLVAEVRRKGSNGLGDRVQEVRRRSDRLMEEHAARGGLQRALASLARLRDRAREVLEGQEAERRRREDVARRHRIPEPTILAGYRERVLAAARRKPERTPMRVGLLFWALMAPVLGGSLAMSIARAFDLPGGLEWVLGPWGMLSGGLMLFGLGAWSLHRHMERKLRGLRRSVGDMAEGLRRIIRGTGGSPSEEQSPSLRCYLESRLLLTEGLTARGFSLRIFERMEADCAVAERIQRSVDTQLRHLMQRAEELGVRSRLTEGPSEDSRDDLTGLFASRSGLPVDQLIAPERLEEVYRKRIAGAIRSYVPSFLDQSGGLSRWRETACLSNTESLLAVGRREFDDMVRTPLPDQHLFEDEVGERLCRFVARLFPNLGFGAKFAGYEGLDPDGVQVRADAALMLHAGLAGVYQETRRRALEEAAIGTDGRPLPRLTSTLEVLQTDIRPNAAYMLSLAQGIRAHSVHNLRRFESFHGRAHLPHDRLFPVSGEEGRGTLNQLWGYRELGRELRTRIRRLGEETGEGEQ